MGIRANTLPKAMRQKLGIKLDPQGRARPPLGDPLVGHVLLQLPICPPSVTHHAKRIGMRDGKRTLVDAPELTQARRVYEQAVGIRPGPCLIPIARPVLLVATFGFPCPAGVEPGVWFDELPDLDNSVKLLKDVLAGAGYLADDKHVTLSILAKRTAAVPFVRVYLRTLLSTRDPGLEIPIAGTVPANQITPIDPLNALAVRGQWEETLQEWPFRPGSGGRRTTDHGPRTTDHGQRTTEALSDEPVTDTTRRIDRHPANPLAGDGDRA